jgi:hypothetical protein
MRLVYIDEAGLSNPKHEPILVVAGVVIDADKQLVAIERHLDKLMHRYIPPQHHDGFVFSAKDIFNGDNKVFRRDDPAWPLRKRLEIADDLAAIPAKFKLPICIGMYNRLENSMNVDVVGQHALAFMGCAMNAEHWMRRSSPNEVCMIVAENNDSAKRLISDSQRYHQDPKLRETLEAREKLHFPLRKIKEDPLFQPKRQSHPLIIADFCAYAIKRAAMNKPHAGRFFIPFKDQIVQFYDDDPLVKGSLAN